jgi:hypothetical protein
MDSVRATAEALHGSLTQMQAIEEMRQTLRSIRDLPKGDAN